MKSKIVFLILTMLLLRTCLINAQNRNMVWTFGDSAGIDFTNIQNPIPISTGIDGRGSCVSISDNAGKLLFYAGTSNKTFVPFPNLGYVFDSAHVQMLNGDSIRGTGWYKELVLIPMPDDSTKYYLFSAGVTSGPGFSYSIVDMNQNGGLGEVVQKNVLLESFNVVDGMTAVKHGNGRDWWVFIRNASMYSNQHYVFLITPNGIAPPFIQSTGSVNHTNAGRYEFSPDGLKLIYINLIGLMEIYDFDRCTGLISNPVTIHPEPTTAPFGRFWGCEFSASGRFLYVSTYNSIESALFQYDLLAANPVASRCTLEYNPGLRVGNGFLRRGPDQKIYFSRAWECDAFPSCYPYPDSVYNQINMNLSVINSPDSLGLACNYTPYSFYLGGKRTYYGLPNNPDYELPAFAGSPCDTLVSQNELAGAAAVGSLHVYYHPAWEKAFINASNLKGKTGKLLVYDMQGKVVHSEPLRLQNGYYTKDLSMIGRANGVYLVVIETEQERLVKKVLID
ncbi:MAG: T9SS type A sorting domain-containing protein [Bacteroidetes bacterium]|nr:T9SS type A sorting domain-containing protein [Bacteroidota bacterium]